MKQLLIWYLMIIPLTGQYVQSEDIFNNFLDNELPKMLKDLEGRERYNKSESAKERRHRDELLQQELIALSKMTPEQIEIYLKLKERYYPELSKSSNPRSYSNSSNSYRGATKYKASKVDYIKLLRDKPSLKNDPYYVMKAREQESQQNANKYSPKINHRISKKKVSNNCDEARYNELKSMGIINLNDSDFAEYIKLNKQCRQND